MLRKDLKDLQPDGSESKPNAELLQSLRTQLEASKEETAHLKKINSKDKARHTRQINTKEKLIKAKDAEIAGSGFLPGYTAYSAQQQQYMQQLQQQQHLQQQLQYQQQYQQQQQQQQNRGLTPSGQQYFKF